MNTARAFGPAAVTGFPFSSQWVVCGSHNVTPRNLTPALQYWVGPALGSIFASLFYTLLKQ